MIKAPLFLVAAERSGTTLLRLMLDHHPSIAMNHEFHLAATEVPPGEGWPPLESFSEWLRTDRITMLSGFSIDRSLSYPELMDSFLTQRRDSAGKPIVGATVHRHFELLLRIWPDARFIHLFRDGHDVASSTIGMGWAGNVWVGADGWIRAHGEWHRLHQQLSNDRWIEIRFEDLVCDPEATLREVCTFLGVPFDDAMLSYPRSTTYAPPDPSLAYQWERKLSPREIQLVEARVGDMLIECGYRLSGLPRIHVSPWMAYRLRWHSRFRTARFGMRRYGPLLYSADLITRRFGPKRLKRLLTLRMNEVESRHLK